MGAVLLDFSAAFDIIINYINGSFSNVKHVKCGVAQGSSLGPLLFLIFFTNDLPLALNKSCVSMYADDSTIYASATTANVVTETLLNKELQSVLEHCI